jgi:hypothetical protein
MLVLTDIRKLWNLPFNGATVLCAPSSTPRKKKRQLSVLLMDCDRLTWNVNKIITEGLDGGKFTYSQLMDNLAIEPDGSLQEGIAPEWNSFDLYVPGKTNLIHYTELKYQPWLSRKNPYGLLWVEYLRDAMNDGVVTEAEITEATNKGWARPSLLPLLRSKQSLWPIFEKTMAPILDRGFVPHEDLRGRIGQAKKLAATPK